MSDTLMKMVNYLIPATGSTRGYMISRIFDATPYPTNFATIELDGVPFRPSGVFIDNSQGASPLIIVINELAYRITCPAGASLQTQFPAPMSMSVSIIGGGQATVNFVDFPVIPFITGVAPGGGAGGAVTMADGASVTLGMTSDSAIVNPLSAASVISLLKGVIELQLAATGVDSDGNYLPLGFDQAERDFTYSAGVVQTETATIGPDVWVRTYTYTGTDLTNLSAWVKQP